MSAIHARFLLPRPGFTLDVDVELPGHGVTAVFGHSGSGKTTFLRCVAGLEKAAGGVFAIDGERWQEGRHFLAAHKRPIGYVFQNANLFPHLTALNNLTFGLKRIPAAARRVDLQRAVELLGIGHLLQRLPAQLSGGEQQRVGIARAILTSPRLLLMDEPLASLDLQRKQEVLPYLERLHAELHIPIFYVSHSADEVAQLADHLVLLEDGKVRASGPLQELLLRSDLPFIGEQDAEVVLMGVVDHHDPQYGLLHVRLPGAEQCLVLPHAARETGQVVRIKVRARDVSLALSAAGDSSVLNLLPVTVVETLDADLGAQVLTRLQLGQQQLIARLTRFSHERLAIAAGKRLWAQIKSVSLLG